MGTRTEAHFARVTPVVGQHLRRARVALVGLPQAAPLVTHLAACGVGRWVWEVAAPTRSAPQTPLNPPRRGGDAILPPLWGDVILSPVGGVGGGKHFTAEFKAALRAQHGPALNLDVTTWPSQAWATAVRRDPPDLVIGVGSLARRRHALDAARAAGVPALLVALPTLAHPCQVCSVFPGDDPETTSGLATLEKARAGSAPLDIWAWVTAAPLCAGLARALLLRHTPYRREDLERSWATGQRALTLGGGSDPLDVHWSAPTEAPAIRPAPALFRTPPARRGQLLIVGLGSLGSVAATYLAPYVAGMIIVDPDHVDAYNPVRQAYPVATVGQPKVQALKAKLQAADMQVSALETALTDEHQVADLIARHHITAALVVTGTAADFAVARALRDGDVPHIVGRCYPRARYWEAMLVDGQRGPALADLRGHLRLGPTPAPTPEQIAAYSDAGALEAEPATLIESGWAAAWMARLTTQLLAPPGLRERWLLELLATERTCLIGGVGVKGTPDGPAYGISRPGEIRAWGRENVCSPASTASDLGDQDYDGDVSRSNTPVRQPIPPAALSNSSTATGVHAMPSAW